MSLAVPLHSRDGEAMLSKSEKQQLLRRNTARDVSRPYTMPPEKLASLSTQLKQEKERSQEQVSDTEDAGEVEESGSAKEREMENASDDKLELEVRRKRITEGTYLH